MERPRGYTPNLENALSPEGYKPVLNMDLALQLKSVTGVLPDEMHYSSVVVLPSSYHRVGLQIPDGPQEIPADLIELAQSLSQNQRIHIEAALSHLWQGTQTITTLGDARFALSKRPWIRHLGKRGRAFLYVALKQPETPELSSGQAIFESENLFDLTTAEAILR